MASQGNPTSDVNPELAAPKNYSKVNSAGFDMGGSSPMEFIRRNLGQPPTPDQQMQKVSDDVKATEHKPLDSVALQESRVSEASAPKEAATKSYPELQLPNDTQVDKKTGYVFKENLKDNFEKPVEQKETKQDLNDDIIPDGVPIPKYVKELRENYKTVKQTKAELEAKLLEKDTELEGYKTGKVLPDALSHLEQRVAQLEPYEKIVNMKLSPSYQKTFVEPLNKAKERIQAIGTDYGLPAEVMDQALKMDSEANLNRWLSDHFDPVGALDVKNAVKEFHTVNNAMHAADAEPEEAFKMLQTTFQERQAVERVKRVEKFNSTAKTAWQKSLLKTKEEGIATDLIYHPTDEEFNTKVVTPQLNHAAEQFGRFVTRLAQLGVEDVPEEFLETMSRTFLLATSSSRNAVKVNQIEDGYNNISENVVRRSRYIRPQHGSSGSAPAQSQAEDARKFTPDFVAEESLKKGLSSRR